jgi:hypothetical protein
MRKLVKCGGRKPDRRAKAMSTRKTELSADHRRALSLLDSRTNQAQRRIGYRVKSKHAMGVGDYD